MYTVQLATGGVWDTVDLDDALDADYIANLDEFRAEWTKRGQITVEMAEELSAHGESEDDHYFNFKD